MLSDPISTPGGTLNNLECQIYSEPDDIEAWQLARPPLLTNKGGLLNRTGRPDIFPKVLPAADAEAREVDAEIVSALARAAPPSWQSLELECSGKDSTTLRASTQTTARLANGKILKAPPAADAAAHVMRLLGLWSAAPITAAKLQVVKSARSEVRYELEFGYA